MKTFTFRVKTGFAPDYQHNEIRFEGGVFRATKKEAEHLRGCGFCEEVKGDAVDVVDESDGSDGSGAEDDQW